MNNTIRDRGLLGTLRKIPPHIHNQYVRPVFLPAYGYPYFNSILVAQDEPKWRKKHLFDDFVPWPAPFDDYKEANCEATRKYVRKGDTVVIVGGGFGVTTVVAAKTVADDGRVLVYEGGTERGETLERTIQMNDVAHICDVRNAIVGEAVKVEGDTSSVEYVPPTELPDCDVLELDCEGSEISILSRLSHLPATVIVETHPEYDAPTDVVSEQLREMGYEIVDELPDPLDGDVVVARTD